MHAERHHESRLRTCELTLIFPITDRVPAVALGFAGNAIPMGMHHDIDHDYTLLFIFGQPETYPSQVFNLKERYGSRDSSSNIRVSITVLILISRLCRALRSAYLSSSDTRAPLCYAVDVALEWLERLLYDFYKKALGSGLASLRSKMLYVGLLYHLW